MNNVTECQMAQLFKKQLKTKSISFLPEYSCVCDEVVGIQGIADFVAIKTKDNLQIQRIVNLSKIQSIDSGTLILSLLKEHQIRTREYIIKRSGLCEKTVRKVLLELIQNRIIEEVEKNKFKLNSEFILPKVEIWAFELKLSNWKRALFQALQNKSFADYSYIVMPNEKKSLLKKNLDIFNNFNIGIILFNTVDLQCEYLNKPRKNKDFINRHRYFTLSQISLTLN